jgi:hypothetical protein
LGYSIVDISFFNKFLLFSPRNLPHGLCTRFKNNGENGIGSDENNIEAPATFFRHTYMQNEIKKSDSIQLKNVQKDKNTRQHIRLRPRQMLCSKCKAMCQETDKGIVPITAVPKQGTKSEITTIKTSPSKEGLRRRPSSQNLKEENNTDIVSKIKLEKSTDKSHLLNTRTSPFIKINIGAGTVMQIPPRLHTDEVDGGSKKKTQLPSEVNTDTSSDDSLSSHRKVKKLKTKDREKERENEDNVQEPDTNEKSEFCHHKKHKRKHRRKHDETTKVFEENSVEKCDENNDNFQYCDPNHQQTIMSQRPRLLYTWRQNKGLSPRRDIDNTYNIKMSPQQNAQNFKNIDLKPRKEYRLRSREKSVDDISECISSDNSQTSESEDNAILSAESGDENIMETFSANSINEDNQSSIDENEDEEADGPPGDENIEVLRPLMMKIQTRDVTKCIKTDGRTVHVGDIVWGKIKGFPWWPGRVLSITVSSRESGIVLRQLAHLAWFGSSTMSHIQCSDLYPFLEEFKLRYNKKKRGPYKMAIKQATIAAQSLTNTHHIDFTEFDL